MQAASPTLPSTVLSWSRGFASLSPGVVPCRGLREAEWAETHRRCTEFVERWGGAGEWTSYRHEPVKMPGMIPIWETKRIAA